jgi:hypothetical protein
MFKPAESRVSCKACGRALVIGEDMSNHQPEPDASESDRCVSRPRKYPNLRCHFKAGHECVHSARVAGTGLHHWRDDLAT